MARLALLTLLPASAAAITRRPAVPDEVYILASAPFTAVGQIEARLANGDAVFASGTLIGSRTVLTAAHVLDSGVTSATISFDLPDGARARYDLLRWIRDPRWTGMNTDDGVDLAVATLADEALGIQPIRLYEGDDEVDKVAEIVGYGRDGNGITGENGYRKVRRAGTNVVDVAGDTSLGSVDLHNLLLTDFDSGMARHNNFGSAMPTEREGAAVSGDSGGALLLLQDGEYRLAGVSSWIWGRRDFRSDGTHGDLNGFVRLSSSREFLANPVPEPGTLALVGLGAAAWIRRRSRR